MPCLFFLLALLAPRVVILVLWFFTTWFAGMFDSILWPIIGFIFLPTTLLWYSAVQNWFGGTWEALVPIIGIIIAILVDLSPSGRMYRR